jgi:hypothetical protein
MKKQFQLFDRREFFGNTLKGAALIAVLPSLGSAAAERVASNPFAYDLSRLEKTDPKLVSHEETTRWRAPHPETRRLALSTDGQLLIASGNYVTFFNPVGEQGLEIAVSEPARAIAVTEDLVYVGLRDHIEVFDTKGQRKGTWDSPGKKTWFTGLAVNANDIFAADSGNRVILRYDRSGKLRGRIGEKNKERNIPGFIVPSPFLDVEIAPDGLLRVNNPGRHRVETYTVDGDFEGAWGTPSMGINGFCGCCNPINLAILSDGRYLTSEKGLPRVKIYGVDGRLESVVAGPESFPENAKACANKGLGDCTQGGLDAIADAQGRIYILDFVTGDVRVMKHKA